MMKIASNFLANHFHANHCTVKAQLKHPDGLPMANQKYRVKTGLLNQTIKGTTDELGNLEFKLDHKSWRHETTAEYSLDIVTRLRSTGKHITDKIPFKVNLKAPVTVTDQAPDTVTDLGTKVAKTFEFQKKFPIQEAPKDLLMLPQGKPSLDYVESIIKAALENNLKKVPGSILNTVNIQKMYEEATLPVCEETTREMVLNGIYPCQFLRNNEGELVSIINWDRYAKRTNGPHLPNAQITWVKEGDTLRIKQLTIQHEGMDPVTVTPHDEKFLSMLYYYNCAALVMAEAEDHLGKGHLVNGMHALAIFRELDIENPIRRLLEPLLEKVLSINFFGSFLIFGKTGVLATSALTPEAINKLLKDTIRYTDAANFKPREPVSGDHRFAHAENLFWKVATDTVDQYFEENLSEIVALWDQIYRLSETLVLHSPAYKPLVVHPIEVDPSQSYEWDDMNEIGDPSDAGRVVRGGKLRSFRPITLRVRDPQPEDIERLKQFCRFVIFTNFWHHAVHKSQDPAALHIDYASLAPRSADFTNFGGTDAEDAKEQLSVARTLVDFEDEEDLLLKNTKGDIYQPFIDNILKHLEEFKKLGYDLTKFLKSIMI